MKSKLKFTESKTALKVRPSCLHGGEVVVIDYSFEGGESKKFNELLGLCKEYRFEGRSLLGFTVCFGRSCEGSDMVAMKLVGGELSGKNKLTPEGDL